MVRGRGKSPGLPELRGQLLSLRGDGWVTWGQGAPGGRKSGEGQGDPGSGCLLTSLSLSKEALCCVCIMALSNEEGAGGMNEGIWGRGLGVLGWQGLSTLLPFNGLLELRSACL